MPTLPFTISPVILVVPLTSNAVPGDKDPTPTFPAVVTSNAFIATVPLTSKKFTPLVVPIPTLVPLNENTFSLPANVPTGELYSTAFKPPAAVPPLEGSGTQVPMPKVPFD